MFGAKVITEYKSNYLRPIVSQIRQIHYFVNFQDEVMADFLFIAGVDIDPDADEYAGYSSKRFYALIKQLPGYDGAVKRRFQREAELEKKRRQKKLEGMKTPNGNYAWNLLANRAKRRNGRGIEYGEPAPESSSTGNDNN